MNIVAFGAAVALAFISAPALAQDTGSPFTGPRIEGRVGWDGPRIRASASDGQNSISRTASKSGVVYGGEVGYDHAINTLVLGGYAGIEGSTAKECGELYGEDRLCLRSGRSITAGARLGFVARPSVMLYGKGGYSSGRAEIDYQDYELILADVNEGQNLDGFHLGAGVEASLRGGLYGRLEYVYSDYGKARAELDGVSASIAPSRHQVVYGMGFRF